MAIESILYQSADAEIYRSAVQALADSEAPKPGDVAIYCSRGNIEDYLRNRRLVDEGAVMSPKPGITAYLCRVLHVSAPGEVEFVTPAGAVRHWSLEKFAFRTLLSIKQVKDFNGIIAPEFTQRVELSGACRLFREGLPLAEHPPKDEWQDLTELLSRPRRDLPAGLATGGSLGLFPKSDIVAGLFREGLLGPKRPLCQAGSVTLHFREAEGPAPLAYVPDGPAIVEHAQDLLPVFLKMFSKSEARNTDAIEAAFELAAEFDRAAQEYLK